MLRRVTEFLLPDATVVGRCNRDVYFAFSSSLGGDFGTFVDSDICVPATSSMFMQDSSQESMLRVWTSGARADVYAYTALLRYMHE